MKLDKIIEYQEIDKNLFRLQRNFRKLEEIKKIKQIEEEINQKKKEYQSLINEMKEAFANFEKCTKKIDEANELEKRTNVDLDGIKTAEELDIYEKNLNKYEDFVLAMDKEINKITKKMNIIKENVISLKENMYNLKKEQYKLNLIISKKKEEIVEKGNPYNEKLKELKKDIDPKLLELYNKVRQQKKMPVFVPYMDGNCFACGMKISFEVEELLKNPGDYAECPNCRRIVYKKEN